MVIPDQGWVAGEVGAPAQRDSLIRFWLSVPMDQLESFWKGGYGELSCRLIRQLTTQTAFSADQAAVREAINKRIGVLGLNQPFAHQLLIAAFLLSPPGLLKVPNAQQQLPAWLAYIYKDLYESSAPVTMLGGPSFENNQDSPVSLPNPDFGAVPNSLNELVNNRIQLNRLLGLSNLYYIDPEDQEIAQELLQLRRWLANLIQIESEVELERIWATDLGDRYWALVRSGVQKEPLDQEDQAIIATATQRLSPESGGGFGKPAALNSFLVAMMYYMPGGMRVDSPEQKIPGWLLEPYRQVFEQKQAAL